MEKEEKSLICTSAKPDTTDPPVSITEFEFQIPGLGFPHWYFYPVDSYYYDNLYSFYTNI
jgi:hypothetical protein